MGDLKIPVNFDNLFGKNDEEQTGFDIVDADFSAYDQSTLVHQLEGKL
jgi:hypothetical protein